MRNAISISVDRLLIQVHYKLIKLLILPKIRGFEDISPSLVWHWTILCMAMTNLFEFAMYKTSLKHLIYNAFKSRIYRSFVWIFNFLYSKSCIVVDALCWKSNIQLKNTACYVWNKAMDFAKPFSSENLSHIIRPIEKR